MILTRKNKIKILKAAHAAFSREPSILGVNGSGLCAYFQCEWRLSKRQLKRLLKEKYHNSNYTFHDSAQFVLWYKDEPYKSARAKWCKEQLAKLGA